MHLILAIDSDIVERSFAFTICPFLSLIEGYLNEFSLIVVVSFDTAYHYDYLTRDRAVGFRQVMVAEVSSSTITDSTCSNFPPAYSTRS